MSPPALQPCVACLLVAAVVSLSCGGAGESKTSGQAPAETKSVEPPQRPESVDSKPVEPQPAEDAATASCRKLFDAIARERYENLALDPGPVEPLPGVAEFVAACRSYPEPVRDCMTPSRDAKPQCGEILANYAASEPVVTDPALDHLRRSALGFWMVPIDLDGDGPDDVALTSVGLSCGTESCSAALYLRKDDGWRFVGVIDNTPGLLASKAGGLFDLVGEPRVICMSEDDGEERGQARWRFDGKQYVPAGERTCDCGDEPKCSPWSEEPKKVPGEGTVDYLPSGQHPPKLAGRAAPSCPDIYRVLGLAREAATVMASLGPPDVAKPSAAETLALPTADEFAAACARLPESTRMCLHPELISLEGCDKEMEASWTRADRCAPLAFDVLRFQFGHGLVRREAIDLDGDGPDDALIVQQGCEPEDSCMQAAFREQNGCFVALGEFYWPVVALASSTDGIFDLRDAREPRCADGAGTEPFDDLVWVHENGRYQQQRRKCSCIDGKVQCGGA
jgi:hypothetical protein